MKQREKCSGRGFDSRQVHQKNFCISHTRNAVCGGMLVDSSFDGPALVSTEQRVAEWTAQ